jgi:outer membrane receptor for ferrienterochelin and colicin
MRVLLITLLILLSFYLSVFSQEQTVNPKKELTEKLGADDLLFNDDSLEMSVISASRSSKKIAELPITIYVVTREEILLNHYYSLIDVIKSLPGIRVSQPGSGELGESFQLRGLTGNLYTMILINGLPIKPSAVVGMPILAQLPIRQAERIEIIYGPAAAVYGADAVSGVINIITREADKGTFVLGDVSLGQNDFRNTDFMIGGKAGRNKNILQYTFYGALTEMSDMNIKGGYEEVYNPLHYLQEKGYKYTIGSSVYDPIDVTEKVLTDAGNSPAGFINANYPKNYEGSLVFPAIEDLPSESNLLGFQLKFRGISFSYNNMYRRSHSSLGQSSYLFKYNNPQNYWGENIRSTTLSYNHEWTSRFSTTTNLSNLIYRMDNNSSMGVTFLDKTDKVYRYSAGNDILFEQLFTVMPLKQLEIMSGITYQYSGNLPQTSFLDAPFNPGDYGYFSTQTDFTDTLSGNFGINPLKYHNFSLFSQTYYSLNSFRFMGGVRFDNNSHYGISVSPRLAALYIFNPRTSVRGSVGFAYKAPPSSMAWQSLAYRAGINNDSLKYLSIPNPDLEPEKYMSVELGLLKTYKGRVNLNISVYYNSIRNVILDKYVRLDELSLPRAIIDPDTATVLQKVNEKSAISRLYGLQANIKFNDVIKSINMDVELSLTFAKSSQKFPDFLQIATNILGNFKLMPNHFGQLKISMQPSKNLYLQVSSIWESNWLRVLIVSKDLYKKLFNNVDGFYSMDFVANYRIGNNLNSFIKVSNLFDERYGGPVYSGMNTSLPYSPQTGRTVQLGLTYRLN